MKPCTIMSVIAAAGTILSLSVAVTIAEDASVAKNVSTENPALTTVGNHHGQLQLHARYYRAPHITSFGPDEIYKTWSPQERADYERRIDWMHKAKYGAMFCFLANLAELPPRIRWTSETWNARVDGADVEKFADQAQEAGLGYVILTLGQNCQYACAPNPVIDKYWKLEAGQYNAKRDLPLDLHRALKKRGIRMMLYVNADSQYRLPRPASMQGEDRFNYWVEALQWYSDHYGKACDGWWVDGLANFVPNYIHRVHDALRHGNPDAMIASGNYPASDFLHGHCKDWKAQQRTLPYLGRWDPEYRIQWQALQYLGKTWGHSGIAHSDTAIVSYAKNIVSRGGVITFDLGTRDVENRLTLEIPERQMRQLRLIRDALKEIPATDGAETLQASLQDNLITVRGDNIILNNIWPARWNHAFTLQAPQETTLDCRVEDGVMVELKVTPASRRADVLLPGRGIDGNLALLRPTRMLTADGTRSLPKAGANSAEKGVDGDPTTGAEAAMKFGWSYEVDLSQTAELSRVALTFHPERYATAFRILVSEDREHWSQVYETSNADGSAVDAGFPAVRGRYIRVVADSPNEPNQEGYQMRVMELRAFK